MLSNYHGMLTKWGIIDILGHSAFVDMFTWIFHMNIGVSATVPFRKPEKMMTQLANKDLKS